MKPKVIVIVGPTGIGKSNLGIELAKKINGEIISADSMQVYKDMNIGTAKVSKKEQEEIKHYMIDIIPPDERYSVSSYKKQAKKCIEEVLKKDKQPIVVGGTGLYINSLIYEIEFQEENINEEYRENLNKIAEEEGLEQLYNMAKKIDPEAMKKISQNDRKRIIRVLEIYHKTGKTKTELEIESKKVDLDFDYKIFGLNMEREKLYERINNRVDKMIEEGLIQEVQYLLNKYKKFPTSMQGLRI